MKVEQVNIINPVCQEAKKYVSKRFPDVTDPREPLRC